MTNRIETKTLVGEVALGVRETMLYMTEDWNLKVQELLNEGYTLLTMTSVSKGTQQPRIVHTAIFRRVIDNEESITYRFDK